MIRTTLMLPEDLRRKAIDEARRRGISFGELVRELLRGAVAYAPKASREHDSLLSDRTFFSGGVPSDYAERHDDYLYGERKKK